MVEITRDAMLKMRKLYFILFLFTLASCTKEVPENEKKILKPSDGINAAKTVENFIAAYNSNDIDNAISFVDADYKGVVADSDDFAGVAALRTDFINYHKQYPEGKWEIRIEEVTISGDFAYVLCSGSFLMPDPIEGKMNPIYSEKSIRVLKRQKNDGWKIFRYIAAPTFSYDQK